jgi:mRNA interferase RelE/StbE
MNKFRIALTQHAIADLKDISKDLQNSLLENLKILESAPFPSKTLIKRLRGFRTPVYRLRVGDFRILYRIHQESVIILRVIDRKLLDRVVKRMGARSS